MKRKFLIVFFCISATMMIAQEKERSLTNTNSLNILQPITVTIGGDFIVTGSFTAYRSQRLDHFITTIFTEAQQKALASLNQIEVIKRVSKEIQKYALRDITLKRANGDILKIDLLKFRLTGDFKYNPYLMNDDVVIFPSYDDDRNIVDIIGAVNKPIKFQFVDGDKLSDAILFAGGINEAYDNVNKVEISRLVEKGEKEELLFISINDDVLLKRGDRIRVIFDENEKRVFKALVLGEVKEPGYIYITKSNSTIRDVITKAGGFTQKAWLERSELIRGTSETNILKLKALREAYEKDNNFNIILTEKYLNEVFIEQLKFVRMNDLYAEDSLSIIIDNTLRVLQNRSSIDFTKINSDSTSDGLYTVKDGDMIVIPQRENLVYVFGQVNNPGHIKYEREKKHDYYIRKAGGTGESAKSDVKIIKGNSLAWITADEKTIIDPGDFIYVPKDVPKPFEYYLRTIGAISSIITAISTVLFIIIQTGK